MKKNILLLFLFFLLITGCNSKKKETSENLHLVRNNQSPCHINLPEEGKGILTTSLIASEVSFVPLQTNKYSLIGKGGKIRINDSIIAIYDTKRLLLFNKKGSFIKQIGTNGKGPGEYLHIFNFELYHDTIYLTSSGKRSMIKYTIDGKFQKEIATGDQITHFKITEDGNIVSYHNRIGELRFYDKSMTLKHVLRPGNLQQQPILNSISDQFDTYFQTSYNKILFSNYFNDTIWNIAGSKEKAAYITNLKTSLLPNRILTDYAQNGDFNKFLEKASSYNKINILETENKIFIFRKTWTDNDLNAIYVYDINTNSTMKYSAPFIYDDILSGMKLKVKSEYCTSNSLVSVISPIEVLKELEKKQVKDTTKEYQSWEKKIKGIRIDDNPIIVYIKLK